MDLSSNDHERFTLEVEKWNAIGISSPDKIADCGAYRTMGGLGVVAYESYFHRTYLNLPVHNTLFYLVKFILIDDLNPPDAIILQFQGQNITVTELDKGKDSFYGSSICGGPAKDFAYFNVMGSISHSEPSLSMAIISKINQDPFAASYGIKDISLSFSNNTGSLPSGCSRFGSFFGAGGTECECPEGSFVDPLDPFNCLPCDPNCLECFGPTSSECFTCLPFSSFTGTDCVVCHTSCQTCSGTAVNECITCAPGLWLNNDGTCTPNCDLPPTFQKVVGDFKSCRTECRISEYVFPDGECHATCKYSLPTVSLNGIIFCTNPCTISSDFYYESGECKSECPNHGNPLNYHTIKICSFSLSESDANYVENVIKVLESTGKSVSIGMLVTSFLASGNAELLTFSALVKMLEYIRFMDILYPPRLQKLLLANGNSLSFNFFSGIPESVTEVFEAYPVPYRFQEYNIHSSFIVNTWEGMLTLGTILAIIFLSHFITWITKKEWFIHSFFYRIKIITKWDLFIILLCVNLDGISVYTSLLLRNISQSSSFLFILDVLICFLMNGIGIVFMAKIFYVGIKIYKEKFKTREISQSTPESLKQQSNKKWKTWLVIFRNFKNDHFLQQSFMFLFLLRIIFFDLVIGYLFKHPMAQAIIITLMSGCMIIYLIIYKPYVAKSNLFVLFTHEMIIAAVNISVLFLAIMDANGIQAHIHRARIGNAIIILNIIFNMIALAFFVYETFVRLIKVYKLIRSTKVKDFGFWRKIIFVFSEQQGLELEDKPIEPALLGLKEMHKRIAHLRVNTAKIHPFPSFNSDKSHDSPLLLVNMEPLTKASSGISNIDQSMSFKDNPNESQSFLSPASRSNYRTRSFFTPQQRISTGRTRSFINNHIQSPDQNSFDGKNFEEAPLELIDVSKISEDKNILNLAKDERNIVKIRDNSFFTLFESSSESKKRKNQGSLRRIILTNHLKHAFKDIETPESPLEFNPEIEESFGVKKSSRLYK